MMRGTVSFDVFCVKILAGLLTVSDWNYPSPKNEKFRTKIGCASVE